MQIKAFLKDHSISKWSVFRNKAWRILAGWCVILVSCIQILRIIHKLRWSPHPDSDVFTVTNIFIKKQRWCGRRTNKLGWRISNCPWIYNDSKKNTKVRHVEMAFYLRKIFETWKIWEDESHVFCFSWISLWSEIKLYTK